MRTIKFRAWDKWTKKMAQPKDGDFIGWHSPSNWKDCYEVMQYTGLNDKNGKEIYEGDVVMNNHGFKHLVEWTESYECEPCFSISKDVEVEVIGNIYETPELIK